MSLQNIEFYFQADAASKIIVEYMDDETWKFEIPVAVTLPN